MKILILTAIMIICLISAVQSIKQIKNHTKAVRLCVMMLENIEMLLEHRNLSIDAIFDYLKNNGNFKKLNFVEIFIDEMSIKNDYELAISKALSYEKSDNLDKADLELLKGYFSIMGKTDLQGQISNCRLYKEFFKQKLKRLESEENMKCKSTGTFIVGAGVLVILVII